MPSHLPGSLPWTGSAALIFEYPEPARGLASARSLLKPGGLLQVILQMPCNSQDAISPSPFSSLRQLGPLLHLVAPEHLIQQVARLGFRLGQRSQHRLSSGKQFLELILEAQNR
nr:hypothetical protein [uncultured Holophaga sp.]